VVARCQSSASAPQFKGLANGYREIGASAQQGSARCLPNHRKPGLLDQRKKKTNGVSRFSRSICAIGENERLIAKDMATDMAEILEQLRAKDVHTNNNHTSPEWDSRMGTAEWDATKNFCAQLATIRCGMHDVSSTADRVW